MALKRLAAMRATCAEQNLGGEPDPALARSVGMEAADMEAMYRQLAIARYEERYVIPQAHPEAAGELAAHQGAPASTSPAGRAAAGRRPRVPIPWAPARSRTAQ